MFTWSNDKSIELIENYKTLPCLWDHSDAKYKCRNEKHDAWAKLCDVTGANEAEVKRKIKNMVAQFFRERKKYRSYKKSGAGAHFISKWFAYNYMLFLADKNKVRHCTEKGFQDEIQLVDFGEAFETEKSILNSFGFYPRWDNVADRNSIRTFVCCGVVILLIVSIPMLIYTEEYKKLLESSVIFTIELVVILKVLYFLSTGKKLRQIESFIRDMKTEKIPDSILEYVSKDLEKTKKIGYYFRVLIAMYLIIFVIMPFLKNGENDLPVPIWAPYDLTKAILFYPTFIGEMLILAISAFGNTSIDLTFFVLIDLSCCQLDILMENLKRLDFKGHVQNELRMNIIKHEVIIRLVETIQNIYSNINFIQCIASALIICIQGFQLVVVVEFPSAKFSIDTVFICMMFFQIYWYCWFGQKISIKSVEVGEACYMANWYEADLEARKTVFIIMERCKTPIKLKASLYTLDVAMLVSILRTSYSYMAILRTLYSE